MRMGIGPESRIGNHFGERIMPRHVLLIAAALSFFAAFSIPSLAPAQSVVSGYWDPAQGGNGHSYAVVTLPQRISWTDAQSIATQEGGYLAAITSDAENSFVYSLGGGNRLWLGGYQPPGSQEPAGGWTWVTGEPFTYINWNAGEPDNHGDAGPEDQLTMDLGTPKWNDLNQNQTGFGVESYAVEFNTQILRQVATTQTPAASLTNTYKPAPANLMVFSPTAKTFQSGLNINLNLPTVVVTLGWKEKYTDWPTAMAKELPGAGVNYNVLAWDWSSDADTSNLGQSASRAANQGAALGESLTTTLGSNYAQSVHFIGHSLGTLVNSEAISVLHSHDSKVQIQDTLLDEASIANQLASGTQTPLYLVNPFPTHGSTVSTENYVSSFGTLHTDATNIILQHDPSNALAKTNPKYWINFHSYPIQWYESTIANPSLNSLGYAGAIETGNTGGPAYQSGTYYLQDPSSEFTLTSKSLDDAAQILENRNNQQLSILQGGNSESAVGAFENLFAGTIAGVSTQQLTGAIQYENNVLIDLRQTQNGTQTILTPQITLTKEPIVVLAAARTAAASSPPSSNMTPSSAASSTSSSYAWIPITIPSSVQYLSLDFTFHNLSPGDLLSLGVNDVPVFQLEDQFGADAVTENTGLLDVSQWSGQDVQLFLGLVAADDNNAGGAITIDSISFASVPEPATLFILMAGVFAIGRRSRLRSKINAARQ